MWCSPCGVDHRTDYCPKSIPKVDCPGCGTKKAIPPGDYLCKDCRQTQAPKFTVTVPASKASLQDASVLELTAVLLKYGIGFAVEPEG
jgi:hypothetical protein